VRLRERQARFDPGNVNGSHGGGLRQAALAFGVFLDQQVPTALFATQEFAGASHFEALGNGFLGLGCSGFLRHGEPGTYSRGAGAQTLFPILRRAGGVEWRGPLDREEAE